MRRDDEKIESQNQIREMNGIYRVRGVRIAGGLKRSVTKLISLCDNAPCYWDTTGAGHPWVLANRMLQVLPLNGAFLAWQ